MTNKCDMCGGAAIVRGPRYGPETNWVACSFCFGTGKPHESCPRCGGRGVIAGMVTRTESGVFRRRTVTELGGVTCPECCGAKRRRCAESEAAR